MESMQDLSELVRRARRGDSDAYEGIVRRFQDMAVGYAYALLGNWQEAEDAAQEAFVSAYYGLLQLRDAAAFPGWFRRIVYTQANRRRRVQQPRLVSLEQAADIAFADPAQQIEQQQLRDEVVMTISVLPEPQRTVLVLHYMNDYSQKEIAAFLEIPLGTVKTRLHYARRRLRDRAAQRKDGLAQEKESLSASDTSVRMSALNDLSAQRPSRDNQFTERVMRLFAATKSGDIEHVRSLLAQDSRLAEASGFIRTSLWGAEAKALHVAVMHGRKDIADLLLAHGADIHARDDRYHFNALIHAIDLADFMPAYAELGMVDFLLERGAEMDVWACAWLGDMAGVKQRLDADPSLVNQIGPGPSTLLSFCRDVKSIQFYLDYGADPLRVYPRPGKCGVSSPLRDQAFRGNYAGLRHLLAHLGQAVDVFWASIMGDAAAVRALLDSDAGAAKAATAAAHPLGGGLSALHLAAQGGHLEVMGLLLQAGSDVNARCARGYTPLHFAICFGPKALLDPLPDLDEAVEDVGVYRLLTAVPKFLIERGADLDARESQEGLNPLELAQSPFEDETDRSALIDLLRAARA